MTVCLIIFGATSVDGDMSCCDGVVDAFGVDLALLDRVGFGVSVDAVRTAVEGRCLIGFDVGVVDDDNVGWDFSKKNILYLNL